MEQKTGSRLLIGGGQLFAYALPLERSAPIVGSVTQSFLVRELYSKCLV
jgi:hypothetical protein